MALSKLWKLEDIESTLRVLANEIAPDKVQPETIRKLINLSLLETAQQLNGAAAPDYKTTVVVSPSAVSIEDTPVLATSFTNSTRTIVKSSHGLTSSDIGKLIVYFETDTSGTPAYITVALIESITNVNSFVVSVGAGVNLPQAEFTYVYYGVIPTNSFSSNQIDVSTLKLDRIIKLVDATNGVFVAKGDIEIETVVSYKDNKGGLFYNFSGEKIDIRKGTDISSYGVITLHYYRLPDEIVNATDYIDIKDQYVPLVIAKCKNYIYELASKTPPDSLTNMIDARIREIKATSLEEQAIIKGRQK